MPGTRITRPSGPRRWALALAALGLWATAVPYLAEAAGLELDGVSAATEVVDHVVPGVLVIALGALLARFSGSRADGPGELSWLLASGAALLAGTWITMTHVPLVVDAGNGTAPWDASLLHLSAGPPAALAALRLLLL